MNNYKELEVWNKAIGLVMESYRLIGTFPREEQYGLVSQIQRAATSVPANIAEGWGRGQTKEYLQFLRIARGSLMELETHLIVAVKLGYLKPEHIRNAEKTIESIGMMLNALMNSLKNRN